MACSLRFIPPCHPTLRVAPPVGDGWLHEVKFDGWRVQLHKDGRHVALYTKSGYDYALQFRGLSDALRSLDADAAVIDGELVACDENDAPDFLALQSRTAISVELCIWAFDLLHLNGRDLCALPLSDRKYLLERIVHRTNDDWLRCSESFVDASALAMTASPWQPTFDVRSR